MCSFNSWLAQSCSNRHSLLLNLLSSTWQDSSLLNSKVILPYLAELLSLPFYLKRSGLLYSYSHTLASLLSFLLKAEAASQGSQGGHGR